MARWAIALLTLALCACNRGPRLSDEQYQEAVSTFYVSLAALQTSQDVLAREKLERLIQIAPDEPAGWANLGLLLLRQQQLEEASQRFVKAAALAPDNAAIARLVALTESRKGNLDASIQQWRRAAALDPNDVKAPFALAQELERAGGDANVAEAQRVLEALVSRSGNLAAKIELARIAARRGDAAALDQALATLGASSAAWPADAQQRLEALRTAAKTNPQAAATPAIFLKNVLIREPEYRAALPQVSTPRSEVGEPLVRLVSLPTPDPQPAPADVQMTFAVEATPGIAGSASSSPGWASAIWMTGDAPPVPVQIGSREVRLSTGATFPFPGAPAYPPVVPDSLAAADLNYDFRTDIVLAGAGGLQIHRQNQDGTFAAVTAATGLPQDVLTRPYSGIWAADVDTDGDLDLVAGPHDAPPAVLRNNTDGTFAVRTPFAASVRMRGFVWADLDGEGVPDAAILDDRGVLRIYLNLRGFEFREQSLEPGLPALVAIATADVTGDGIMDVIGAASDGSISSVSRQPTGASFAIARVTQFAGLGDLPPGATRLLVADLDNNAAPDLLLSTPSTSRVVLGGPKRTFAPVGSTLPGGIAAAADLDGNGRLELFAGAGDGLRTIRSSGQQSYRWQAIRPRAVTSTGDQRINSFGIGGEIEVRTGLHAQKQVIAAPVVHFGLGVSRMAEVARVTWPNGVLQSEFDLPIDQAIGASQRLKGSCPWLFAWNGREMSFVTDFIWRSPLGLRINAQSTADVLMTEDWVKVRGDQLVPRNGEYELRITAELWETHFFDLVSLLVVDHPEGTEAFVDERFTIPPPRLGVTATGPVQPLQSARDDRGRDVSAIVRSQDDEHLDFAGRGEYQGVTRDHFVEVDLPDTAPRTGPLWLVARGWVHPTDSSVNVALSHGRHATPEGLSLHVADASGAFKVARTGLGFPSGKDKTVLIDLTGLFPTTGPRRLRLSTNLEIFWDRIGWAVGRPDVTLTPRRIDLKVADLRYRGYSTVEQRNASTPERPRYVLEGVAPRWRDLEGFYTRFGDVRELLQATDDRYVIMNAGDEIRLTFPEAAPPAPGMVRDFVLVGDGWVKDGDYNTTASRTVLPLPTHRSPSYVQGNGRLEDDPIYKRHREDFERYHTRYVSTDEVRDALRVKIDAPHSGTGDTARGPGAPIPR